MCLRQWVEQHWYRKKLTGLTIFLKPFSWLFFLIITFRRFLYRRNFFKKIILPVPVIIVGNLTVGGTGKTPFIIWLADYLKQKGFHPGIISRGVGGKKNKIPVDVSLNADPKQVGDEAILLARRTDCPIVVSVDRVLAGQTLLAKQHCDVLIADDGLQHYRLARQMEIVMIDAAREWGNQCLIPAGPLREPLTRLREVDLVIRTGVDCHFVDQHFVAVIDPEKTHSLDFFAGKKVHAIAAIGHPERFFNRLKQLGMDIIPHYFPDHYLFQAKDISFSDDLPVIMTEKDAVKCEAFATLRHWYLPVDVVVTDEILAKVGSVLRKKIF